MKKIIILLTLASSLLYTKGFAQIPFNTMDSLNVNNINALALVHGDMWWNPTLEVAHCHFPKNSPANIQFASSLWMSGYDGAGNLHIAAQTYRQNGNDYWPGPLDSNDTLTYATSHSWAKIWKVLQTDIQSFIALTTHDSASTPKSVLTWPGKGNTYATGNGGVPLTITTDMAPFNDLNGNGIYEPLLGEYPLIKGDMALWWVFSDNGPVHTETKGKPIGLEIHAMAYGYKRGTLIDNVIYYDYYITNKSANTYHNFRFGQFDDVDLGYYLDDYIGFDSSHRMGICYNGSSDDGIGGGHPVNSYGTHIPMVGLTMLVLPGDGGTLKVPAGTFDYYNNDASIIGNPDVDTQYNNYMRSRLRNGDPFTNDFTGRGIPSKAYGSGPVTSYVFTGDPSDTTQWSECNCSNNPGDRRFIITSSDFTFPAGSIQHVAMALVTTNPDTLNACPGASFDSIKIVADTAWANYINVTEVKPITTNTGIRIYPNPAHNQIVIETSGLATGEESITFYNIIGQKLAVTISGSGNKKVADLSGLPNGIYLVVYNNGTIQKTVKVIKE